jgi:hypothetical protein
VGVIKENFSSLCYAVDYDWRGSGVVEQYHIFPVSPEGTSPRVAVSGGGGDYPSAMARHLGASRARYFKSHYLAGWLAGGLSSGCALAG